MPEFTSPSKKYPGTVKLPEWYDWGRVMAYDAAIDRARAAGDNALEGMRLQAEAIIPMVDEWHIVGLPEKPSVLPATPLNAAVLLNKWLLSSIQSVIGAVDDDLPFLSGEPGPG